MFLVIKDKNLWNSTLDKYFKPYYDIYFCYEYFEMYSRNYNSEPESIFFQDENINIFWPHLIRKVNADIGYNEQYYDLTTPYGYGGPIVDIKTNNFNNSIKEFLKRYFKYCQNQNYLCEFVRFHPILNNWSYFNLYLPSKYLNDVIIIDLTKSETDLWESIKKGHKYNIKKTEKENCEIEIISIPTNTDIENFAKIYKTTMDRNNASEKYYFTKDFITDHFTTINNTIIINAKYNQYVISSSMFIMKNDFISYHLSGTDNNIKGTYPSNLILWKAIKWAKHQGYKYFNLGGGRGKNDSLFEFKKGFSRNTNKFYTSNIIYLHEFYDKISNNYKLNDNNYFPAYRYNDNTII